MMMMMMMMWMMAGERGGGETLLIRFQRSIARKMDHFNIGSREHEI